MTINRTDRRESAKAAIRELRKCALAFPQLRLGQIIVNAASDSEPFHVENETLAEKLKHYLETA